MTATYTLVWDHGSINRIYRGDANSSLLSFPVSGAAVTYNLNVPQLSMPGVLAPLQASSTLIGGGFTLELASATSPFLPTGIFAPCSVMADGPDPGGSQTWIISVMVSDADLLLFDSTYATDYGGLYLHASAYFSIAPVSPVN